MIDRELLDAYLRNDTDVAIVQRISTSGYDLLVTIPGMEEQGLQAPILVTNDVNPIFLNMYARVSDDHLQAAIRATGVIGAIGLGTLGDDAFALRYTIFMEHSDPLALTNGLRALAMAYWEYVKAGGEPL